MVVRFFWSSLNGGRGNLVEIKDFDGLPMFSSQVDQFCFISHGLPAGSILEFGVFKGESLRGLSNLFPQRTLYGFDSWEGLPEDWVRSDTSVYREGHFKTPKPEMPDNVTLIEGFFEDTLPEWLDNNFMGIALIHIDADLYSSAKFVLDTLDPFIVPGARIIFDELVDWQDSGVYPEWPQGEWKALCEWLEEKDRVVKPLSRGTQYSACVEVEK